MIKRMRGEAKTRPGRPWRALWLALGLAVLVWPGAMGAADPIGAYCLLEQVVFEPSSAKPDRVELWGAFALADTHGGYAPVARGYLYYTCSSGRESECRAEWGDLLWYADSGKALGFGSRTIPMGRLRPSTEALHGPDVYPINGGWIKVDSKDPAMADLLARLKAAVGGGSTLWPAPRSHP